MKLKANDTTWTLKKAFAKRIASMTPPELVRLMVELSLAGEIHVSSYSTGGKPESLLAAAARLGIDHVALRAELTGAAKAKAKPKAKKSAPKAAKAAAPKPARKPAAKPTTPSSKEPA